MSLEFKRINAEETSLLREFLDNAGSSLEAFRYFNTRPFSCLKNHLLTIVGIGSDGKPSSYGHLDRENGITWLALCVVEENAGKGFGTETLAKLLSFADAIGVDLNLTVDKKNSVAIRLYEKNGFRFKREENGVLFYGRAKSIQIYKPWISEESKANAMEAISTGWISSSGHFTKEFEDRLASFLGAKYVVAVSSGTAACHLALESVGVSDRKRVICPALSFVATANAAVYCHKDPSLVRFVDVDPGTWNMDLNALEQAIKESDRPTVLFWTSLYGNMSDMDQVAWLCSKHGIVLCEDSCEAIGAKWKGRMSGTFGVASAFSFHAAKSVTTGEGGALATNDKDIYEHVKTMKGQGQTSEYCHSIVGYNYRMTNIQAALGVGQMSSIQHVLEYKDRIYKRYWKNLNEHVRFATELDGAVHSHWAVTMLTEKKAAIRKVLAENGIETRGVFVPLPSLPPYAPYCDLAAFPVANRISETGMSLPTFVGLKEEEIDRICNIVKSVLSS